MVGQVGNESVALTAQMLALGVKRFKTTDIEVEFHDSAVAQALTPQVPEEPFDAIAESRARDKREAEDQASDLDLLFRSVG